MSFAEAFYTMFFNDFQFLPNKLLVGVRISVETEQRDRAEKGPNLQHFSFPEVLQGLPRITPFLDVPDSPNASKVANK